LISTPINRFLYVLLSLASIHSPIHLAVFPNFTSLTLNSNFVIATCTDRDSSHLPGCAGYNTPLVFTFSLPNIELRTA